MTRGLAWLLGLLCLPFLAAQDASTAVDVRLVSVGFSVRNSAGALRRDLTEHDLEAFEDGVRQQFNHSGRGADLLLRLGVLTDAGGSQDDFVNNYRRDLDAFFQRVLGVGDGAFLVGFGNRLRLVSDFSGDSGELLERHRLYAKGKLRALELGPSEERHGGTAFFDAIYHSIQDKLTVDEVGRRAIVALSDGADNSSVYNLLDVIEIAQASDVRVFSVWYSELEDGEHPARNRYGRGVMERLASETGGTRFTAASDGLQQQLGRIGEDLRSSYLLRYYSTHPEPDGRFRRIEIRPRERGLQVKAKTGRYAR